MKLDCIMNVISQLATLFGALGAPMAPHGVILGSGALPDLPYWVHWLCRNCPIGFIGPFWGLLLCSVDTINFK